MTEKTLSALRAEFKALTGKNPSPRLDAAGVQAKIDEHNAAAAAAAQGAQGGGDAGAQDPPAANAAESDAGEAGNGAGSGDDAENGAEAGAEPAQGGDNADQAGEEAGAETAAEAAPEAPEGTAYVRHPEHVGCSFRGVEIAPDEEGLCLVPLGAVEELRPHGFELVS